MTVRQTRQYAMLVQVRDFGRAHQAPFPEGSEGHKAFAAVTAAVAAIDAFTRTTLTAARVSHPSKRAANLALTTHIAAIARSARVMAKATPGADEKFPVPTRKGDIAVLQTGRLFLQEAAPVKDAFIRCGLAPTFLEDLQQAVTALEQAISGRSTGRTSATVSQHGIRMSLKTGGDAVRSLDALVANVFGHHRTLMHAWKRDRHVDRTAARASAGARHDRPSPQPAPTAPSMPGPSDVPAAPTAPVGAADEPMRRAS